MLKKDEERKKKEMDKYPMSISWALRQMSIEKLIHRIKNVFRIYNNHI